MMFNFVDSDTRDQARVGPGPGGTRVSYTIGTVVQNLEIFMSEESLVHFFMLQANSI